MEAAVCVGGGMQCADTGLPLPLQLPPPLLLLPHMTACMVDSQLPV